MAKTTSCRASICWKNTTPKAASRPISRSWKTFSRRSSTRSPSLASRFRPATSPRGPTITRYEVYPAKGVRVDKIVALERDIARATRAERINILAPIPGKDTVGIEIANSKGKSRCASCSESDDFQHSKAKIPARARQGRVRQNDHRRPRRDAARARRRHHRLGQKRLHQFHHREHPLPVHAGPSCASS